MVAGFFLVSVFATTDAFVDTAFAHPIPDQIGKGQTMSDDEFWAIVDETAAYESDPGRQLGYLRNLLNKLSAAQIEALDVAFQRQLNRAYTWDLWGAAYVVHGGASDDGFEYFRRWLISKGRGVFERVVANPDELADLLADNLEGVLEFEEFTYVANGVWAQKTGRNENEFGSASVELLIGAEPKGHPFEEDQDFLKNKYPKLWRRFGDNPLM